MARHLLIFTILLRAASVGLAGTIVAAVANVDTRIVVVFVQPQHFTRTSDSLEKMDIRSVHAGSRLKAAYL